MKTRVLVIEDDRAVQTLLKRLFEQNEYQVEIAGDGKEALFQVKNFIPDIVILDLGLPDIDGLQIIERIKRDYQLPILVLSARDDYDEKVRCLDSGADDYVTKPFHSDELLARVRVVRRRHSAYTDNSNVYHNGELQIDYESNQVMIGTNILHLTPMEYRLLVLLSQHTGKVLTYNFILKEIWGHVLESELSSLRVFMATLRKKIEQDPKKPIYIQTHMSVGYQMLKQN